MKIVLAPNSFKGSLSASQAARAMEKGICRVCPEAETVRVPVADGGDGLMEIALESLEAQPHRLLVTGPCFELVESRFCVVARDHSAIIEMALASGLILIPEAERNPLQTTTFGTGELIRAALDLGIRIIRVGIGGSGTCDGGIGMATALGARFLDKNGVPVKPVGGELARIARIDLDQLDSRLSGVTIEAACDVDNPLLGANGAARVYGPQKGATPDQVELLEQGLGHLADIIERDLGVDVRHLPGGGAAGGLGAGLFAFLKARLRPGIEMVLEMVDLRTHLQGADLVLTGEGKLDRQTCHGKAPAGVAALAKARNIPCIALAGSLAQDLQPLHNQGITAAFSLCPGPITLEEAQKSGEAFLACLAEQVLRCYLAGRSASTVRG